MADRSVSVFLRANVSGYLAGIEKAKIGTRDFARDTALSATKHKQSWDQVGKGMLVTGGVIAVGIGMAVKASMDFQAQMAQVKSLSGATASEMAQLADAAKTTGIAFGISAKEAADAETELVKAGISVKDILGGGLQGALTLAADGQMNVAEATQIAASALTIFGLKGKDIPHIADLLAAGADKALGSVGDLGQALTSGGTVAKQFGWNLEQTVGTLAEFASNAQIGERGGTLLRQMLLQLVNPSKQAQALMDQYGLSIADANGNMVDSSTLAGRLHDSFTNLTPAVRNHALAVIFGAHAIQGANILVKDGAAVNAQWVKSVNDSGFAAKQAAGKMDSLAGDVQKLKASFQTALIDTGDQAQATLRGLTKDVTGLVQGYNNLSPASKKIVVDFAVITSGVLLAGGAFLTIIPRVAATRAAMLALAETSPKVVAGLTAAAKAGSLLAVAFAAQSAAGYISQSSKVTVANSKLADSFIQLSQTGKIGSAALHMFGSPLGGDLNNTTAALKAFSSGVYNSFSTDWSAKARRVQDFGQTLGDLKNYTTQMDAAFAQLVSSGHQEDALNALTKFTDAGQAQGISLKQIMTLFPKYSAAVLATAGPADAVTAATQNLQKAQQDAATATKDLSDQLTLLNKPMIDLRGAQIAYAQSVADSTAAAKKNGEAHSLSSQKGRDNASALNAQATAAMALAQQLLPTTDGENKFHNSLVKSHAQLVATAESMGYSKSQANKLADSILAIPVARTTKVGLTGIAKAIADARALGQILRANSLVAASLYASGKAYNAIKPASGGYITGGKLLKRGMGGAVFGPGTGTSDSVPAMLSNGEFVINAKSVAAIGVANLHAMNRYAAGGMAGYSAQPVAAAQGWPSTMILEVDGQQFTAYVRHQAAGVTASALNRAGDRVRAVKR